MTWEFVAAALCFVVFCGIAGRLFSGPARLARSPKTPAAPDAAPGVALLNPGVPSVMATGPALAAGAEALRTSEGGPAGERNLRAVNAPRKVRPLTRLAGQPRGAPTLVSTAPRSLKVLRGFKPA